MKSNIVEEIRKFVEERKFVEDKCKKPTSKYGYLPYKEHFIPMHNYSVNLAKKLNADLEVVKLSAWLHDIGSIIDGRENHHITGAEIAEEKLKELNYPLEKIEKVKKCILNHRSSKNHRRESIEEQIIAEADAINAFDRIDGLFESALVWEKKDRYEAKKSIINKLNNKWNQLSLPKSKKIVKPKYEAIMLLLN